MIDTNCQLPTPSARAWSIDLSPLGGPQFIVLAASERHARERLIEHLEELGKLTGNERDHSVIYELAAEWVPVIW
jgi:hypothetical protein